MKNTPESRTMTHDDVAIISEQTVYQGYFSMAKYCLKYKLYAGGWSDEITREVFDRGNSAAVLLYDPKLAQVVLVEQFRAGCLTHAASPWSIELVAGSLAQNETPEALVIREAKEEADCQITNLVKIADVMVSPGGSSEKVTIFIAQVDSNHAGGIHGLETEHEDIKVIVKSVEEAYGMVESGQIITAPTIIALQWLRLNYQQVKAEYS